MACDPGNLRQLAGKWAIDSATIEFVILKTKRHVIHQRGTEGVVPIDSPNRRSLEGRTTIADNFRKSCERRPRQVLVIKHFGEAITGSDILVHLFRNGVCVRA